MAGSEPSTLYHLLQEQQEPFNLQIYLSERGCPEKRLNSPISFICHRWISRNSIKRSVRCMLNRRKEDLPWSLKMITSVYNQLIPLKARPKTKKANNKDRACISITMQKSAPDPVEEVSPDKKLQFHCWENDKQLGPVSALEDTSSIGSPTLVTENFPARREAPKEVTESYILCSSLWELLFHSGFTSSIGETLTEIQPQDSMSKTGWHKLVLDLVKEVVQKHHQEGYLESEELGKIIAEKMKYWTKQFGDASNSIRFQGSDLRHPGEEWRCSEQEKKDAGLQIVDAILEEINAEFVAEMTSCTSAF